MLKVSEINGYGNDWAKIMSFLMAEGNAIPIDTSAIEASKTVTCN
jgi:hypothetical protein